MTLERSSRREKAIFPSLISLVRMSRDELEFLRFKFRDFLNEGFEGSTLIRTSSLGFL